MLIQSFLFFLFFVCGRQFEESRLTISKSDIVWLEAVSEESSLYEGHFTEIFAFNSKTKTIVQLTNDGENKRNPIIIDSNKILYETDRDEYLRGKELTGAGTIFLLDLNNNTKSNVFQDFIYTKCSYGNMKYLDDSLVVLDNWTVQNGDQIIFYNYKTNQKRTVLKLDFFVSQINVSNDSKTILIQTGFRSKLKQSVDTVIDGRRFMVKKESNGKKVMALENSQYFTFRDSLSIVTFSGFDVTEKKWWDTLGEISEIAFLDSNFVVYSLPKVNSSVWLLDKQLKTSMELFKRPKPIYNLFVTRHSLDQFK